MATAYIGLGSNLNSPNQQIKYALEAIDKSEKVTLLTHSSLYQNPPLDHSKQADYVNAVAKITTNLTPHELLSSLLSIETEQGRVREMHWGSRIIDLDLLLFDNFCCEDETLTLPHPGVYMRFCVLLPLHEIEPELLLPSGETVASLMEACDKCEMVICG